MNTANKLTLLLSLIHILEEILARNGFEDIKTTADTQGIWRVVEGTINS